MRLGEVALKIRTASTRFGNKVAGAVEFAAVQEYTVKEDTAFVIPLAEADRGDNKYDTSINQRVNERFGVVCAIKNDASVIEKLGLAAYDLLHDTRAQLFTALLGWLPSWSDVPIYYKGGRLLDIRPDYLWYQFEFQTEIYVTSEDGVDSKLVFVDDFLKIYTEWLTGNTEKAILPMTGPPPQLPQNLITPNIKDIINFKYPFGSGFSKGYDTLETEAADK